MRIPRYPATLAAAIQPGQAGRSDAGKETNAHRIATPG